MKKRPLCVALFFCIAAICLFSYSLVLDSFLILDDYPNLDSLAHVHNFTDAISYSSKSTAGHRYIAYFSFALQANSFQAENYFWLKLVNLLIHVANSLLIFFLLRQLLQTLRPQPSNSNILLSLLVSTLWLTHPIHVNTVLYTVQRMTLMSAMFSLIGLNYAIHYYYKANKLNQNLCFADMRILIIFSLFTAFAILCKETGILNYAFLILLLSLKPEARKTNSYYVRIGTLLLPIIALIAYLVSANKLSYSSRSFTLIERLLTQPSIINSYIDKLIFSWPSKYSLFYDQYATVNTASSPSFVIPVLLIITLCSIAIFLRRTQPVVSLGILWFFIGHLLESSIIPLELYFDHRNYLPSLGIMLCLAYLALLAIDKGSKLLRLFALLLLSLFILNNLIVTHIEASTWKDQKTFVHSSIIDNPSSQRTWQQLASFKISEGDFPAALIALDYAQETFGYSNGNAIYSIWAKCILQQPWEDDYQKLYQFIPSRHHTKTSSEALRVLLNAAVDNYCPSLSINKVRALVEQYIASPKDYSEHYNMHFLLVETYLKEKNIPGALSASLQLPNKQLKANFLLMQIDLALQIGDIELSRKLYEKKRKLPLLDKKAYEEQFKTVEKILDDQ